MAESPYDLLKRADKTTLSCPGGIALGYGPGPGLRHGIFWNRAGSLFSCYRPAIAVMTLFDAADCHAPAPIRHRGTQWEPARTSAGYTAAGLRIDEVRTATRAGLRCTLELTNTGKQPKTWVLVFHGQVQQWEFFDYQRGRKPPHVDCLIDPRRGLAVLRQPHPHDGLPEVNSIQRIEVERKLDACGFGLSEGDLHSIWHAYGCLASLKMRLGQVGGRVKRRPGISDGDPDTAPQPRALLDADSTDSVRFSHHAPLYYFAIKVHLKPGASDSVTVSTSYHTDDEGGQLDRPDEGYSEQQWRRHLEREVPQLKCDDEALERYWYYVWYVLRANRTAPGAHIKSPFTAPSKYMYWGPWIWDGYFHALGEMWLYDRDTARDTIRAVLGMQFPNGFIPVCSGSQYRMCFHEDSPGYTQPGGGGYASYIPPQLESYEAAQHPFEAQIDYSSRGTGVPAGDDIGGTESAAPQTKADSPETSSTTQHMLHNEKTQTPLITIAAAEYVRLHGDKQFAAEVLPALIAYDDWLWRRRTDSEGRFILWHGDESGWDNATRHFPVPALPFDVQVHCLLHRMALSELAGLVGSEDQLAVLRRRINITRAALKTYWCNNDKWYYDFGSDDGGETFSRRKQIAASGLFSLLVTGEQRALDACLNALQHPRVFGTEHPVPTLAACDPDYAPHGWGWNGPAWLQVNYFTICGLLKARQYSAAFELWEKTRALIIKDGQPASYELYDPELGTGMGCPDYSWQAMVNNLIITRFAGITPGSARIAPALPPGIERLRISGLPGLVREVALTRLGFQLKLRVEFQTAQLPSIDLGGLGRIEKASIEDLQLKIKDDGRVVLPDDLAARRSWEVAITCR